MKDIREAMNIKKSFKFNMDEIDSDKLIEFFQRNIDKNEKYLVIEVDSNRNWTGYTTSNSDNGVYNKMDLTK